MLKTKKTILGIVLGVLMALCLIVGITGLSKPQKAQAAAWGEWKKIPDISLYGYGNMTGTTKIGADYGWEPVRMDLGGRTWTINETFAPRNYKIGAFLVENGTIRTTENMKNKVVFDITGGINFINVTFEDITCDNLVTYTSCDDGWNIFGVYDCTFKNCTFDEDGGAFYIDIEDYPMAYVFQHTDFINCTTTGDGSVMYFEDAGAGGEGLNNNLDLVGCNFYNCHADGDGGVIYMNDQKIILKNFVNDEKSFFYNCSSDGMGGAIFDNAGNCAIENCIFYKCYAEDGGGAIVLNEANTDIYLCEFYENSTDEKGAAIWNDCGDINIRASYFENNGPYSGTFYSEKQIELSLGTVSNWYNDEGCEVKPYYSFSVYMRSITEAYGFSQINYDKDGNLIRGDSIDNPILICSFDDLKSMIMNLNVESYAGGNWSHPEGDFYKNGPTYWYNKYYCLMADIDGFYFKTSRMQEGHFSGNGHIIRTRLPETCINGYAPAFTEYGRNDYSWGSMITQNASWTNANGQKVSGKAYVISNSQYIHVFRDGCAYVVKDNITYFGLEIKVEGSAVLILPDGVTFTMREGARIELTKGNTLTISGNNSKDERTGKLLIYVSGYDTAIGSASHDYRVGYRDASVDADDVGTLNMYGGRVLLSSDMGAAFGGGKGSDTGSWNEYNAGWGGDGGNLNVYGGWFTAISNWHAAYGGSHGNNCYDSRPYGWGVGEKTVVSVGNGITVRAGDNSEKAEKMSANSLGGEKYIDIYVDANNGTGTLMTDGSLAILFGVLAGVFLITSGAFAYLYFAEKKKKKN